MSKLYCYVCRKDVKEGKHLAEDPVLSFMIWAKKSFGILRSKEKTLVVCPTCLHIHGQARERFKRKLAYLCVIALAIFAVQTYFVNLFVGLIFAAFILAFSLLYYAPGLESEEPTSSTPA